MIVDMSISEAGGSLSYPPQGGQRHGVSPGQWAARLEKIKYDIESVTAGTEGEFLSIGSKLSDFQSSSGSIFEMTSSLTSQMSSPRIVQTIDRLNSLLEKLEHMLKQSEDGTEAGISKLNGTLEVIEGFELPLAEFRDITKSLRAHAVSTKVQSTQLVGGDHGFRGLGDNVKQLSEIINSKSLSIMDDVAFLNETVKATIQKVTSLRSSQQAKARAILDDTMSSICSLTERYGFSSQAAKDMSERSRDISRSIREVVMSLQFHDIVRQALVRSAEGFGGMVNKAAQSSSGGGGGMEAGGRGFFEPGSGPRDTVDGRIAALASDIYVFCAEQQRGLGLSRDGFVGAVETAVEHLDAIASNVHEMLGLIKEMAGDSELSFLQEVQQTLTSVTSALEALSENKEAMDEISEAILSIAEKTAEMAAFVEDISAIGEDLELIALNAGIKAAQIGDAGKPLGVLANSIQKLSGKAGGVTRSTSGAISSILDAAEELTAVIRAVGDEKDMDFEAMSEDLRRMVSNLSEINTECARLISDINASGQALHKEIVKGAKGFRVHRMVQSVIDRVVSELGEIEYEAGLFAGRKGLDALQDAQAQAEGTGFVQTGAGNGDEELRTEGFGDGVELF